MDVNELVKGLTPFKRKNIDICLWGKKSQGKSYWMAYNAKKKYEQGFNIYSTFKLSFPFKLIRSIGDLEDAHDGYVLLDDAERFASSKFLRNIDKAELIDVMLDFGKANLSTWFAIKRLEELDKSLRSIADFFIEIVMYLKYQPVTVMEYDIMSNYMDFCEIQCLVYDSNGQPYSVEIYKDLQEYKDLFDTTEKIRPITKIHTVKRLGG